MIRHVVRAALVASLVISSACGGDAPGDRPPTSAPTSSTTPTTTQAAASTSSAPATTTTTTTTTTPNLPTTTIKNQSASNSPRTTTTTTTTVAELPGGIQVSPSINQVLILSTGPGRLLLGAITENSGSGLTVDTSDCGATMPSGNVCVVRFNSAGLPSGTFITQLRIESNAPTSPDIVNVTITVP